VLTLTEEILLVLVGVLLSVTIAVAVEYYRQLHRARHEYEKAKDAVGDIVLSINRQFKQEADKLELVAYKVESVSSKSEYAAKKGEELNKKFLDLDGNVTVLTESGKATENRMEEISQKMRNVTTSQEALVAKLSTIEEQTRQFSTVPEANIEAVIPIKREKALAPLTETELSVLEMLALEGSKTAPEIKEKIRLSREHTARLMKKLYEGGYLERDTGKIPFKYHVKEEMSKLLRKVESGTV
jgi:DNA-binding Lrp family transcriptional regulator